MSFFTPHDSRNYSRFTLWLAAAIVAFVAATMLIDGQWIPAPAGWALTVVAVALIVATVRAYVHFLRNADELLRKVHLDALAFAFGAGAIGTMGYRLCERLGAPKLDINDGFLVMMLIWIAGQIVGARRYAVEES